MEGNEDAPSFLGQVVEDAQAAVAKAAPAGAGERRVPFVFSGSGSEFFKIWIVNVLLSIVTLGIYSAWAKVRTLRYFYGNTSLDGNTFEYLAEPIKILKGRLIVFAVFLVYFVAHFFFPLIGLPFGLLILLLMPWVIRQSLRFRYHYTVWRGVRFAFAGGLWDAAKAFILWPFVPFVGAAIIAGLAAFGVTIISSTALKVLTSVLAFLLLLLYLLSTMHIPWHRQTHYLTDNSRFGAVSFENHSTPRDFFKVFVVLLGILFGFMLVMTAIGVILVFAMVAMGKSQPPGILINVLSMVAYLIIISILSTWYKVRMTNLRLGQTNIGPHRLVSSYATESYLTLFITNTLATIFTLGLFYPFAKVRTARYAAEHTAIMIRGDLDGFVAEREAEVSALGSAVSDFLDIDIGF